MKGLEGGKPQREWVPTPTVAAISAWGGFGAGAKSLQAHAPFITPRHEQIEKHSPFPVPYMEQISVKEIIQFEGVRQIIPNRHHSGSALLKSPYMVQLNRLRSSKHLMYEATLHEVAQQMVNTMQ